MTGAEVWVQYEGEPVTFPTKEQAEEHARVWNNLAGMTGPAYWAEPMDGAA